MKVYLAAPWLDRDKMPALEQRFKAEGHSITEYWWEHPDVPGYPDNTTPEQDRELFTQALRDAQGVVSADVLVIFNTGKSEGKAVETGYALAGMKPTILVGKRSNIFHWLLPEEHIVESVDDALRLLA